jgi:hypothetical protein
LAVAAGCCLSGCAPAYQGPVFDEDLDDPSVRAKILAQQPKSPALGALLATIPPAGHAYAEDTRGAWATAGRLYLLWPAIMITGVILIASDSPAPMQGPLTPYGFGVVLLGGGIGFFDWVGTVFDAYGSTVRYNEALENAKARVRAHGRPGAPSN